MQAGITAQNLEEVFPGWVMEIEASGQDRELIPDGEMVKAVSFPHDFNAYLIEAMRAQQNRIEEQQARIDELRESVQSLLERIEALEVD